MKIFLTSDSYPPLIGGATRATALLAEGLRARGHDVVVATAWQAGLPARELSQGITIYRVRDCLSRARRLSSDPFRHTPPPWPDPEAVVRIRRLVSEHRPDVVVAYGWLAHSTAVALEGKDIPLVVSARDYGNICAKRTLERNGRPCAGPEWRRCVPCASASYGPIRGPLAVGGVWAGSYMLRRRMTGLHSCSGYVEEVMRRFLVGDGHDPARTVLPDFRPQETDASPDETLLRRLPREPYILYVGALRKIKGIGPLLTAYSQLHDPPPLVLIGTRAPDSPTMFPANVTFLENVPHATVMAAWDRALFGVAPSVLPEPLGNVVHEAMSRGRPMIGTWPGGHGEMIRHGVSGLLVPCGDTAALRQAMSNLLEDSEMRLQMGEAAREAAVRFTADRVIPAFEAFLADVARNGEPGGS